MIINFSNIGSGSGGGSGYTLPIATETRLGGVKIGSGLTIDHSTGVLSASGGTGSQISVTQVVTAGTKIATVSVDGVGTDLFAPEGGQKVIVLDELTQQELADLYTDFLAYSASTDTAKILENNEILYYHASNGDAGKVLVRIEAVGFVRSQFKFKGFATELGPSNKGLFENHYVIALSSNGTLDVAIDKYCTVLSVFANGTGHTLSYDTNQYDGAVRMFADNVPVSLRVDNITTLNTNMIMVGGIGDGKLYATWTNNSGETWEGEWNMQKNAAPNFFRKKEDVSVEQTLSAGTKIGTITVNGTGTDLFAPAGGGGAGIQKVNALPQNAQEGDVVWLNGETKTGYTILCAETDAGWPWEIDRNNINIDGSDVSFRLGGSMIVGRWENLGFKSYSDIKARIRVTSSGYPILDVIDTGNHTIDKGSDTVSITSGVTFPMKGCLYIYADDMWQAKPEFEWTYNSTEALSVVQKIMQGIEEFDIDNFIIKAPVGEKQALASFEIYNGAQYGLDFKTLDYRTGDWGYIDVYAYRLDTTGAWYDQVGSKSMSVDDIIYQNIPYKISESFSGVKIDSGGTIIDNTWDNLGILSNLYKKSAMVEFEYEENNYFSASTIKYWYRQYEQVDGQDKLFYYVCAEIPINGTVYKGVWKWEEYNYPSPFTPLSWTAL